MEPPTPTSWKQSEFADAQAIWIKTIWSQHGQRLLQVGIGLMVAAALWRFGLEIPRLLWGEQVFDAVDLLNRYKEVNRWFSGMPVYGAMNNADYPPASYTMLWPLVGWLNLSAVRWLWAITTLMMVTWLGWLGMRESLATTRWEKVFMLLMPFALYPASATINMGQAANHVMPALVAGLLLMQRSRPVQQTAQEAACLPARPRLIRDIIAAIMVIFSFVKPTLSAPFFWLVCFAPGRWRPFFLVSFGYLAMALIATQFQSGHLLSLHVDWLNQASTQLGTRGHANIHTWLEAMGLSDWMLPASLILFAAAGIWTYCYRRVDPWILMSVAALVARFWTDHRMFDDLLIWVPMIALFRLAKSMPWKRSTKLIAALLFTLNWFALMGPARFLSDPLSLSSPLEIAIKTGHSLLWLSSLIFFLVLARQLVAQRHTVEAVS
ncbi:MAG: glycosyltransferase 87 family protein [Cyanobacteria bacterium P01_F01_bin.53]